MVSYGNISVLEILTSFPESAAHNLLILISSLSFKDKDELL